MLHVGVERLDGSGGIAHGGRRETDPEQREQFSGAITRTVEYCSRAIAGTPALRKLFA